MKSIKKIEGVEVDCSGPRRVVRINGMYWVCGRNEAVGKFEEQWMASGFIDELRSCGDC